MAKVGDPSDPIAMAFDPSMLDAEGSFSSLRGAPPSVSSTSSPGSNAYSLQNSATPATVVDHEKSSSPEQTSATNGASGADGRKDSTVPAACLACVSSHLIHPPSASCAGSCKLTIRYFPPCSAVNISSVTDKRLVLDV